MKKYFLMAGLFLSTLGQNVTAQKIDVNGKGEPFIHYWSEGTCAGRANEGLRTSWVEQLKLVKEYCGFKYLRMHGIFDDDMFVYFEDKDGNPIYNWQYTDEVYDRMLEIGVKPFVELSFFPKLIAKENSLQQMWYRNNVSFEPKNLQKWGDLCGAFAKHLVERYGIEEVATWYFEVWNEPNLNVYSKAGFFHGTRSDYFNMYRVASKAIKAVDGRLRVGGPATSNFIADKRHEGEVLDNHKSVFYTQDKINEQEWKAVWMKEFLAYCEKENLPVDFITCHPYPTDYALDPETGKGRDAVRYIHSLRDDIAYLKKCLTESKYPEAEIHLTEWSTSPNSRDVMHDALPPAAFIMKGCLDNINKVNSLMYWTFTDIFEEKGGGQSVFHGGFGMITFQGMVKPSFHAYRMLNQLGDEMLSYENNVFVTRSSTDGKVVAVAFNYPKEFIDTVPTAKNFNNFMDASNLQVDVTLTNLRPGAVFLLETLDKEHGYVYNDYLEIGAPKSPTREQTAYLVKKAWNTKKETLRVDENGTLALNRELLPWTCVLIKEL